MSELPRIKVCGLTRVEDVQLALESGADAFGFVAVASSPRCISVEVATRISSALSESVRKVGVFVDNSPQEVSRFCAEASLNTVQLCGAESPEDWNGFPFPIWRRIAVDPDGLQELALWADVAEAFVLDHPSGAGGTGLQVDFDLAAQLAAHAPCLLAGGLHPENVQNAIRQVQPVGVDASSGLESGPGIKDNELLVSYIQNAATSFQELTS
ncbi:MAG: phosphoribosylanthranilate isomerase [Planctomycetota bacterium]|nr:phosphoribosylanthranilate isomerase [Planctomycetota bacterium]